MSAPSVCRARRVRRARSFSRSKVVGGIPARPPDGGAPMRGPIVARRSHDGLPSSIEGLCSGACWVKRDDRSSLFFACGEGGGGLGPPSRQRFRSLVRSPANNGFDRFFRQANSDSDRFFVFRLVMHSPSQQRFRSLLCMPSQQRFRSLLCSPSQQRFRSFLCVCRLVLLMCHLLFFLPMILTVFLLCRPVLILPAIPIVSLSSCQQLRSLCCPSHPPAMSIASSLLPERYP